MNLPSKPLDLSFPEGDQTMPEDLAAEVHQIPYANYLRCYRHLQKPASCGLPSHLMRLNKPTT